MACRYMVTLINLAPDEPFGGGIPVTAYETR